LRRSKKPLIGAGSIILAFILGISGYRLFHNPLIAGGLSGIATFVAPAYYAWKMDPVKSLAAGILASMVSGGIAWLSVNLLGGTPTIRINILEAFTLSLATGGLLGHLLASAYFMSLLDKLVNSDPLYSIEAACFLVASSSTILGLAIIRSIRKPRYLASPSILLVMLFSLGLLVVIFTSGYLG